MSRDLIQRLRAATTGPDALSSNVSNALLREAADRIAALEAEASEGERRGLERAAGVADQLDANAHDIGAAIRALIPAPAREGWQPIETAPRDGTRFLALEGHRHFDCWWHWFGADQVYNWQDDADSEPDPTHWMPLPSPPQDREKQ